MAQQQRSPDAPVLKNQIVASKPSQTLGKWVDNLLGAKKARERAAAKAAERERAIEESRS